MDGEMNNGLATVTSEKIVADDLDSSILPRRNLDGKDHPKETVSKIEPSAGTSPQTSLVHDISVEYVNDVAILSSYRDAWSRLSTNALEHNVLLDPAFAFSALSHLIQKPKVRFMLIWLEPNPQSRQDRELIGLFPLTNIGNRWGLPVHCASAWQHIHCFETTPLLDRTHSRMAAEGFFRALKNDTSQPRFLMFQLLPRNKVWETFRHVFTQNDIRFDEYDNRERAILKSEFEDGHDYLLDSLGKKRSKEYRRLLNRLGDHGSVEIRKSENPIYIANAAERFLELEAKGWKGQRESAFDSNEGTRSFFRDTLAELSLTDNCTITELVIGEKVIASVIVVTSGRRAWMWKIAYDEEYARYSPGVLLVLDLTKSLIGNKDFDFVDSCAVPDHPMINNIWRERLPLTDILITLRPGVIPPSIIAKLEGWRRVLRAKLKFYYNTYFRR